MGWQDALWAELGEMKDVDRFVAAGEWIDQITHELLPELSRARRVAVVAALEQEGMDAQVLADTVGSRRTTITRLAEGGRAIRRADQRADGQRAA